MSILFSCNSEFFQFGSWMKGELGVDTTSKLLVGPFIGEGKSYGLTQTLEHPVNLNQAPSEFVEFTKEEYLKQLSEIISRINKGTMQKLVFSRRKFLALEDPQVERLKSLVAEERPKKFSYKLYNQETRDFWFGASPEVLISRNRDEFVSHSLAGTAQNPQQFSDKEKKEHQYVTDYIVKSLKLNREDHTLPRPKQFGNLWHLFSEISWRGNQPLINYVNAIHPTPAVCGIPVSESAAFISENEKSPRDLYTGYIGIDDTQRSSVYVNLRCAQLFKNGILLYAGGGITKDSDPEAEYRETELKMEAILTDLL